MSTGQPPARDEFYESLLGDFLDESAQLLDRLNEDLLKLDEWTQANEDLPEAPCDEDLLNSMFRAAHSLKGLSAMLGLQEINQLTHKVENVFDAARKAQIRITRDVVNLIFEAVDRLSALIEALKDPDAEPVEYETVLEKIHQLLKASGAERPISTQTDAERALAALEQAVQALNEETGPPSQQTLPSGSASACQAAPLAPAQPEGDSGPTGSAEGDSPEGGWQVSGNGAAGPVSSEARSAAAALPSGGPSVAGPGCSAELVDPLAHIEDEPSLPPKYVAIFIDEASETLDQLTEILLAAEGAGQKETVEQLMVLAHRWKGSAASIGLHRAAKVAHLMEDILQGLLADLAPLTPALTDLLLRATDGLRQFVDSLRQGHPSMEHLGPVARELLAAQQAKQAGQPSGAVSPGPTGSAPVPPSPPAVETGRYPEPATAESGDRENQSGSRETRHEDISTVELAGPPSELSALPEATMPLSGQASGTPLTELGSLPQIPSPSAAEGQPPGASSPSSQQASQVSGGAGTLSAAWRQKVIAQIPEGARAVLGQVYFEPNLPLVGLKGKLIYEKLCRLGEVCQFDPPPETLEEVEELEKVSFGLLTEQPLAAVESQLEIAGVRGRVLESWPPESSPAGPSTSEASTSFTTLQVARRQADRGQAERGQSTVRSGGTGEAATAEKTDLARGGTPPAQPGVSGVRQTGRPAAGAASGPPSGSPTSVQMAAATAGRVSSEEADSTARQGSAGPAAPEAAKPTETLRVDIERLDELMNLAGQLVINKARFNRIGDNLKTLLSSRNPLQMLERISAALEAMGQSNRLQSKDAQGELESLRATARRIHQELVDLAKELQVLPRARQAVYELQEAVHQLERVTDGLQQTVMQTRMVPIGPLFARFKRVVRDITRLNGKSARLVILGEKTELDKRMIDELGDPLIHLVRNALDHGIEPPDVREALGKPRQGTVTLEAFHRGNSIVIRVSDDGRGLDAEKILRKAIEKGLVSPADAEKMTREQIYQLIWQPGLSTAEKVTEISGRGMGMDIVLAKISELNGTVEIDSTPGVGTTMTIKLPLTLAILPSLMIQIDGDTFALPIEAVAEIVHLKRSDMYTIQGRWVARVRNTVISVVHLRDIFTWNQPGLLPSQKSDQTTLVILGETGRQIGLAVDHVLGEEDVVIKSISENYHNVPGLAGASILGDGRVALILDVTALVEMASGRHAVSSC